MFTLYGAFRMVPLATYRAFISETRRETLRRYAIVLRLQDRGSPSCASLSCCAWKTGADPPWSARSPGQSLRLRTPCCAWAPAQAFRGLGVRRDERPPDTRLYPAHPLDPWQVSGSPVASLFGRENCHGHFAFLGLTPVGSVPHPGRATVSATKA